MSGDPVILRLVSDHLDGALDAGGRARLEAWLAEDPAHRQRFVRMAIDHSALIRMASVMAAKPPTLRTRRILARRRPRPWLVPFALAASVVLAIGGWWLRPGSAVASRPAPESRPLLVSARGATAAAGSRLSAGTLIATDAAGDAQLRWDDGSEIRLAAGTEVEIGAGIGLRLVRGRIAAEFAAQPTDRPARFTANGAEVIVVGTGLAVAASDGEASAEVTHGRVRVRRLSEEVTVDAGECVTIAPGLALRARPLGSPAGVVHRVPAGGQWPDQAKVQPGDTIELGAGVHHGAWRLTASGTTLRPIVVRGAGMDATILDATGTATSGERYGPRGALQVEGRQVTISGLALRGARNATANAAGLRLLGSVDGIAITGCRVEDCDVGISADPGPGSLLVEDCIIAGNGTGSSTRATHNVQLANHSATLTGCRISDARFGVNVELHDGVHRLIGNRISGGAEGEIGVVLSGTGSSSLDLVGTLVAGRPRAADSNHDRFIYVLRSPDGAGAMRLGAHACTLVTGEPINWVIDAPGCQVQLSATIIAGSTRLATAGTRLAGLGNCLPDGADGDGLAETLRGAPGFVDAAQGDYRLLPASPCRQAAQGAPPPPALAPPGVTGAATHRSTAGIGAF